MKRTIIFTSMALLILTGWGMGASLNELPPLSVPSAPAETVQPTPPPVPKPATPPSGEEERTVGSSAIKPPALNPALTAPAKTPLHPEFPFYPSLIRLSGPGPVSLDNFTGAPECGVCHKQIYEQWKGSMHAAAFTDPIWRAFVALGSEETGGKIDKYCIGCHTPIGLVTGDVTNAEGIFSEDTDLVSTFGVQCDACHVMSGNRDAEAVNGEPGNGSFAMDPGKVKRGPYETCEAQTHQGIWSALHVTSKICANCHQSFHGNVPVERTYDEWKHSIYARKGIQCQHCHMMPVDKAVEAARTLIPPVITGTASELKPDRTPFFPHWFLGGNVAMARQDGYQDHAREMMHRLQTAAALEVEVSDAVVTPGQLLKVRVKVRNVAAGHNLPTSLTWLRQLWLNIQVTDQDGRMFFHSGQLTDTGNIEQGTRIFGSYAVDKNGQHTLKPWAIDHFLWNHTIPPKGEAFVTYTFVIPRGIRKEVRINVKLRYRSYPQSVVNRLLKEKSFPVPIIDMAEKRLTLPVAGEE